MRAISVKQPYAEAIASGVKRNEFRTWRTNHRGDLLIVASRTPASPAGAGLPMGVAICVVNVVACDRDGHAGYAWRLEDPRRVENVPIKGSAAFYHVADDLIRYTNASAPTTTIDLAAVATERLSRRARAAGPYTLHIGDTMIEGGIRLPERARQRASELATSRGSYVRIQRDGLEISGAHPPK